MSNDTKKPKMPVTARFLPEDVVDLLGNMPPAKFDETVELSVNLWLIPDKVPRLYVEH